MDRRAKITKKVRDILIKDASLETQTFGNQDHFIEDLMLDSMAIIETVVDLEREFGLRIDDELWESLWTVDQVVDYLMAHTDSAEED